MLLIVALAGTWLAVHLGLFKPLDKHAAYEATLLTAVFAFALYLALTVVRVLRAALHETQRQPVPTSGQVHERELFDAVHRWLERELSDTKLHIQQAFLFGSILHDHYATSGVDLIVVLHPKSNNRRAGDRLRNRIAPHFKKHFGHRLHLEFKSETELSGFLSRAGEHEQLIIKSTGTLFTYLSRLAHGTSTVHEN